MRPKIKTKTRWPLSLSKDAALKKFSEVAGIAIGEASVCWGETPKGVFNSDRAVLVLERVIKAAQEMHAELSKAEELEAQAEVNKVVPINDASYSPVLASASISKIAPKLESLYAVGFEESGQPIFWASGDMRAMANAGLIFTDMSLKLLNGGTPARRDDQ